MFLPCLKKPLPRLPSICKSFILPLRRKRGLNTKCLLSNAAKYFQLAGYAMLIYDHRKLYAIITRPLLMIPTVITFGDEVQCLFSMSHSRYLTLKFLVGRAGMETEVHRRNFTLLPQQIFNTCAICSYFGCFS